MSDCLDFVKMDTEIAANPLIEWEARDAGHGNGKFFYYKQMKDAYVAACRYSYDHKNCPIWALDSPPYIDKKTGEEKNVKGWLVMGYAKFWEHYKQCMAEKRCWYYEVLTPLPLRLFIDVEIYFQWNPDAEPTSVDRLIQRKLAEFLMREFPDRNIEERLDESIGFITLDSSNAKKISRHYVLRGLEFKNIWHLREFMAAFERWSESTCATGRVDNLMFNESIDQKREGSASIHLRPKCVHNSTQLESV